jgi:hypothetical protein
MSPQSRQRRRGTPPGHTRGTREFGWRSGRARVSVRRPYCPLSAGHLGWVMDAQHPIDQIPGIVERLYQLVAELERAFPGRPFTPDGHLVGSLGEVLASHHYNLDLLPCSSECHDARARDGRLVQVKATQGSSVALRSSPDHLLVLRLRRDGRIEEIYNGPGVLVWNRLGKPQKNGQRPIGVRALERLMIDVPEHERLPRAT